MVVDFAVDVIGAHRLEARAAVANGRGNGALRKIGAVQEGVLRRSFLRNGVHHDQVLWGIVAEDWRLQRLSQEPTARARSTSSALRLASLAFEARTLSRGVRASFFVRGSRRVRRYEDADAIHWWQWLRLADDRARSRRRRRARRSRAAAAPARREGRVAQSHPEVDRGRRCADQRRGAAAAAWRVQAGDELRVRVAGIPQRARPQAASARPRHPLRRRRPAGGQQAAGPRGAPVVRQYLRHADERPAGARARRGRRDRSRRCSAGSTSSPRASCWSPSAARSTPRLQRAMDARRIDKDYLAIVRGKPSPPRGTIDLALDRDPWDRRRITVTDRGGQPSVTRYERLVDGEWVFARALPADHRPHAPDPRAPGGEAVADRRRCRPTDRSRIARRRRSTAAAKFPRQALHSWRLAFRQPRTGASCRSKRRCPARHARRSRPRVGLPA